MGEVLLAAMQGNSNSAAALERDLLHGQFCLDSEFQFQFTDSELYLNTGPSPAVMQEQPDVIFSYNNKKRLDHNRYATKKTIAQGMLDIALLSSNASQLKYLLQVG